MPIGNPTVTGAQLLNAVKPSPIRVQTTPIIFRSFFMTQHPWSRQYGVFVENEQRRGAFWCFGDITWKGKTNLCYSAEGIIGQYYGYAHANVVRRAAGSGGNPGSIGGWVGTSATNNSQNWGGGASISISGKESAVFTFTGDACGIIGAYYRSDAGGYAIIGIDGDYTKANGPEVRTITQSDINSGKFATNITLNNGNTTPALGCKYVDFRRAFLYGEDLGLWEDTAYSNTSHTCEILTTGTNNAKDTSGSNLGFSAFFASSSTQGTVLAQLGTNGASAYPTSSFNTSNPYVLAWRPIAQPRVISNAQTKPIVGASPFVEDSVYEMKSAAGGTYRFNRQTHADGSSTGPMECSHVPTYVAVASGGAAGVDNLSGQAHLKLRATDGLGFTANDYIWIESNIPMLRKISSIATDDLTLLTNLTSSLNLNVAAEKVYRCETVVSGAVTASASVTLASATHQIAIGDVLTFVLDANIPVTATCKTISGTALVLDRAVTIADTAGVLRLSMKDYETYWLADNNIPLYLSAGCFWTPTDKLSLRRVYMSSYTDDSTTANGAAARGATTITVVSDANIIAGNLVSIDANGTQIRRVVSKAANVLTLDKALDSYTHTGLKVSSAMLRREDVITWNSTNSWQMKVQWLEKEYRDGDLFRAMYDVMHTQGYEAARVTPPTYTITNATNVNPIVVTTAAAHGMATGDGAKITNVNGNTAANGNWVATVLSATTFSIPVAGNGAYTSGGTLTKGSAITDATNATPISITSPNHQFVTGDRCRIAGVGGNTNANADWRITYINANTFTLDGSVGNGAYTSGGTACEVAIYFGTIFNCNAVLGPGIAPVVDFNYDSVKPYNIGGVSQVDTNGANINSFYSTDHPLVYSCWMEDIDEVTGTGGQTCKTFQQGRATGDYKVYFMAGSNQGANATLTLGYNSIRKGCYRKQIRRIPTFANNVARQFIPG